VVEESWRRVGASWLIDAESDGFAFAGEKGVTITPGTSLKTIVRETAVRHANAAFLVAE
jgi:hypothetical protein